MRSARNIVVVLAVLNPIMVILFKRQAKHVTTMTHDEKRRKQAETSLMWINVYQVCLMVITQLPHTAWTTFPYLGVDFCGKEFAEPICDGVLMILDALDFFIVVTINKKMRGMVMNLKPSETTVHVISVH